ncbi:MAG: DUF6776 family protein [Colwellia sp.]
MNWLAKINLSIVVERLGAFKSAVFLLVLILLCFFSGYRVGNYYHDFHTETLNKQKVRLEALYAEQEESSKRIHTLEVELAIEQLANQRSQVLLKDFSEKNYEVKKDLAFYEKVMSPGKDSTGLVIDNIKIVPMESEHKYHFEVALVQHQVIKRYAKGHINLKLIGSINNKATTLSLKSVSKLDAKALNFSFKYFQILDGDFILPENFKLDKVKLEAVLVKTKWQKYQKVEKTYNAVEIIIK